MKFKVFKVFPRDNFYSRTQRIIFVSAETLQNLFMILNNKEALLYGLSDNS